MRCDSRRIVRNMTRTSTGAGIRDECRIKMQAMAILYWATSFCFVLFIFYFLHKSVGNDDKNLQKKELSGISLTLT